MYNKCIYEKIKLQSTLIITNSKGLSEKLRDIRTPIYQILKVEKKKKKKKKIQTTTTLYVIGILKLEIYRKYCPQYFFTCYILLFRQGQIFTSR